MNSYAAALTDTGLWQSATPARGPGDSVNTVRLYTHCPMNTSLHNSGLFYLDKFLSTSADSPYTRPVRKVGREGASAMGLPVPMGFYTDFSVKYPLMYLCRMLEIRV